MFDLNKVLCFLSLKTKISHGFARLNANQSIVYSCKFVAKNIDKLEKQSN
jgi:hypothetical protein